MPTIKTVKLKDGSKRYEFRVDEPRGKAAGVQLRPEQRQTVLAALADAASYRHATDPGLADTYAQLARELAAAGRPGRRQQITRRYKVLREAKAELARIGHQSRTGEYVRESNETVNAMLDSYERSATFEREANTAASYRHALQPVRERLGHRRAQSVSRDDIEALRDWMLTSGRRRGGKPGTGLGARSVRLTLGRLSAAFAQAVDDGRLYRNPCRGVKLPAEARRQGSTWSEGEARRFLAVADADRLAAVWRMSLYGLRRGEVCGLRWSDIDLDAGTVTIGRARVLVDNQVIQKSPKSAAGYWVLPLDDALIAALKTLRKRQAEERLAAGPAHTDSGFVAVDELGAPVHPEWFTNEFHRVAARAGVPRIRLHDGRHTTNSLLAKMGVPPHIRASWCGHGVAVNVATYTYTHARPEDFAMARDALSKIYNAV